MIRAFSGDCAEVTHCMSITSQPVKVGCFCWDDSISCVLDKLIVGIVVSVGNGEGGGLSTWGLD